MTPWNGWIYIGFTAALFVAFILVVIYSYNPKRKNRVETPKYRMLDDDDQGPGPDSTGKSTQERSKR